MKKKNFEPQNIKLIVSDFDGIFTDGKLEVFSDGKTSKKIDYKDIMGIAIILKKGINFAIISGEKSPAIDILKEKFPQIDTFQNERNKINVLNSLIEKYNISPDNVIYLGDDINDIKCLELAKYSVTVPEAHATVKNLNNIYVTKSSCGNGAFREVTDLIQ